MITTEQIKALRDSTGVSVMQCKKALEEAGGDTEKALVILRKKSAESASKKSDRTLGAGVVESYIHSGGAIGALVELSSETDFVARNGEFKALAYEIAMQVAATDPQFLKREEVTEDDLRAAKEVFQKEAEDKPENIREKVVQGKIDGYLKDKILLEQPYIKDPEKTIGNLVEEAVQKFGERIEIRRFARFNTGK